MIKKLFTGTVDLSQFRCCFKEGFLLKNVLLSSLVIIIVPTIIFAILYGMMLYAAKTDTADYSEEVLGSWTAIQYYSDGKKYVCSEENAIYISFYPGRMTIDGNVLPKINENYEWSGGKAVVFHNMNDEVFASISFDSKERLKLIFDEWGYTVLFKRTGAGE